MRKIFILLLSIIAGQTFLSASPNDTTKNELHGWYLTNCYLVEPYTFDTTISEFQILNYVERFSISNSSLGTIGKPYMSNVYSFRADLPFSDFYYDQFYYLNLLTVENQIFYHAKKPYIELEWNTTPKKRKENQVNVLFTQNINKKWNVGFRYRLIASGGQYPRSATSQNSLNLFTSYIGDKYSLHSAYIRNVIRASESGGIIDTGTVDGIQQQVDPDFATSFLKSANSRYFKSSFFVSQQYKFGITQKIVVDDTTTVTNFKEAGRLNYVIRFDNSSRSYSDKGDEGDTVFYSNYINKQLTHDSVDMTRFENTLYWSFKEINRENFKGRLTIGGTYEQIELSMIDQIDPIYKPDSIYKTRSYRSIKLFGNLRASTKSFLFDADASYYPKGENAYKESNYDANLIVSKAINIFKFRTNFYAKLGYKLTSPNLFVQNYFSNNFKWDNDFSPISTSNTRFGIEMPKIKFGAELLLSTVKNYIYFDSVAIPRQTNNLINILSVSVNKEFKVWYFRSVNKIVYQLPSDNSELRLPVTAIYHSLFFDKSWEKINVQVQLGYDLNFTSWFQANGYMPATGVFYQSRNFWTGNYAIINGFIKLRIKTVLIFAKMEHLNNMFLQDKFYHLMKGYPAETSVFKFGVSWRFQN